MSAGANSGNRQLFDHLIGAELHRRQHGEAERLGSLQIDCELELCGLLHRKLRRLGAFRNPASVNSRLTISTFINYVPPPLLTVKGLTDSNFVFFAVLGKV